MKRPPDILRTAVIVIRKINILLDDKLLDISEEILAVIAVDIALEAVRRNYAEDSHKALGIYRISAGNKIYVVSAKACSGDEILNVVDLQ